MFLFICACKPYVVIREIDPPSYSESSRAFDVSCEKLLECEKMVSAVCSYKFDIISNIDYGPYEHNIQAKCK